MEYRPYSVDVESTLTHDAYLQVKRTRTKKRKLVLMLNISCTLFVLARGREKKKCSLKVLLLLLNELLLQLIITDLKCNFMLKISKMTHTHTQTRSLRMLEMMHWCKMCSTKWKSEHDALENSTVQH